MNLGGPSAARLADGLRAVFFRAPVPSGWTLTAVLSKGDRPKGTRGEAIRTVLSGTDLEEAQRQADALFPSVMLGDTDELCYAALGTEKLTHSHVHATILRLLGLDYKKLTFEYEGRQETLIGVNPARVISEIFA